MIENMETDANSEPCECLPEDKKEKSFRDILNGGLIWQNDLCVVLCQLVKELEALKKRVDLLESRAPLLTEQDLAKVPFRVMEGDS